MKRFVRIEKARRKGRLPKYTVLHCRAGGRHQVGWCFRMCQPKNGRGLCGRVAPHSLRSRAGVAIAAHQQNQAEFRAEEERERAG